MINCTTTQQLRTQITNWRAQDQSIAFVPTMGNLHAGHLSLIALAKQKAKRVVVSIYVNPLQFSPDEDFSSYPRTLQDDLDKLLAAGVDLVFLPETQMIYPQGELQSTFVDVPGISTILEGHFRPGFFRGVATVVLKLFNLVQPDYAVFGEKDFQQLLVIRRMVKDLHLAIEIIAGEIKREPDGLAMSSRNRYLSTAERQNSLILSRALSVMRSEIEALIDAEVAEKHCVKTLEKAGFQVDYVSLRETSQLENVSKNNIVPNKELIILAAAKIGRTRLIDNMKFIVSR